MNASGVRAGLCGLAFCGVVLSAAPAGAADKANGVPTPVQLAQAAVGATSPAPLPSLEIGPPPAAKPPERDSSQPAAAPRRLGQGEQQLQLRVDPLTGKPLTSQDLKAREAQPVAPAQRLQPRRLVVPRKPAAAVQEVPAKTDAETPAQPGAGGIVIQRLARPDPGSIGVLEVEQGGMGHDMWDGSERSAVARLMPALPVAGRSLAVRSLQRRLLLSTSMAPEGRGDSVALLHARIERLWAAGWIDDTAALLRVVPPVAEDPALDAIRIQLALITGQRRDACTMTRNLLERAPTAMLKKTAAFCLAAEGRTAEVDLYEQVLYADGIEDPPFYRLLGQLAGREPVEAFELPTPSPLHLAMLAATDRLPGEAVLEQGSPYAIYALAMAPRAEPWIRVEAAEIAAERGIISEDALRQIYAAVPLTAQQESDPVAFAREEPGALAAAAFYRAVAGSQNVEATLNLVEEAWRHARLRGRESVISRALRLHLQTLEPREELSVYAAITMRVLLHGGALQAAQNWFQALVRPARHGDPHAASAVFELAPLIYAADVQEKISAPAQTLSIWWRAQNDAPSGPSPARRALILGLLEGLGRPMPESLWIDALDTVATREGLVPSVALWHRLQQASATGRRAETALLAIVVLGNEGPERAADAVLSRVVEALQRVGLSQDAHALAVEGLLVHGF